MLDRADIVREQWLPLSCRGTLLGYKAGTYILRQSSTCGKYLKLKVGLTRVAAMVPVLAPFHYVTTQSPLLQQYLRSSWHGDSCLKLESVGESSGDLLY